MNPTSQAPLLPLIRLFGRWPAGLVGIAITLVLGALGCAALIYGAHTGRPATALWRSGAQLWINSLTIGYLVAIALFESRRLDVDLAELRPALGPGPWRHDPALFARNRHPRALAAVSAAGALFGVAFNIASGGTLGQLLAGKPMTWEYAWGPPVLVLLWTTLFHALWLLLGHARLLARIARHGVQVELSRLDVFDPVVNAGLRHLLLIIIGLAVIPMQGILAGDLAPIDFVPALAIVLPVALLLLATPIHGVYRAVAAARGAELARIDADLERAEPRSDRALLLALYRHQVAAMPAWPLSLRRFGRVGFYLVIPPLAWVAAALVESGLSAWL
jgi:hypothetical protein